MHSLVPIKLCLPPTYNLKLAHIHTLNWYLKKPNDYSNGLPDTLRLRAFTKDTLANASINKENLLVKKKWHSYLLQKLLLVNTFIMEKL